MLGASIDLGTNTCLLLIAEIDPETKKVIRIVQDHATVVRLGQGVDKSRQIHPEAAARTLACLKKYQTLVQDSGLNPNQVKCVATSQARDASNGAEFFGSIEQETGFKFQVITGDQEAEMTFKGGLLPGQDPTRCVVIDIGGGSTEFMSQQGGLSLDIGSVRFTERYLKSDPVTDAEFWACQSAVDQELEALAQLRGLWIGQGATPSLVAVAGTATTLGSWQLGLSQFDAPQIDSLELTRGDLHRMVEELKWRTVAERQELPGVEPGRADVLLAGALILWRTCEVIGFPGVVISTRGLRFGVLEIL